MFPRNQVWEFSSNSYSFIRHVARGQGKIHDPALKEMSLANLPIQYPIPLYSRSSISPIHRPFVSRHLPGLHYRFRLADELSPSPRNGLWFRFKVLTSEQHVEPQPSTPHPRHPRYRTPHQSRILPRCCHPPMSYSQDRRACLVPQKRHLARPMQLLA